MRKALLVSSVLLLSACGSLGEAPSGSRSVSNPTTTASPAMAGSGTAVPSSTPSTSPPPTASSAPAPPPSSRPPTAPRTTATLAPPSAPPASLQQAFETVRSGVVRFEVATCDGGSQGSGFQIAPDLVATVAHVVHQGQVIRVIEGTTSTAGTVIGLDQGTDVALVRTVVPLPGHLFPFASTPPRVGDGVAALGFPKGEPLGLNPGTINGLDRKAVIEDFPRHDLIELDAATHPGSSGGPVIRADGAVVGLVDAGIPGEQGRRLAVSSATAKTLIDRWRAAPQPQPVADCTSALDPEGNPVPVEDFPTREDRQAVATLDVYFDAVNVGDFPTALAQLARPQSLQAFTASVASTYDSAISYRTAHAEGPALVVWTTFTSNQDPGKGPAQRPQETCTRWSLDYVMAPTNGLWLIQGTRPHEGVGNAPCPSPTSGTPSSSAAPATGSRAPRS